MNQWHENILADADGLVLGRTRPSIDKTYYAGVPNRELGEYVTEDLARKAVERYYSERLAE